MAAFRCSGRLGECRIKASAGDIEVDQAGPVDLSTAAGAIIVDHVTGHAEVSTSSGRVRLREIDGTAVLKNSTVIPGSARSPATCG